MKILVTGAAGFLGYHTAIALAADGHELVLVDDFSRNKRDDAFAALVGRPQVTFQELDLLSSDSWLAVGQPCDAVIHFAAVNGTRHFYERPFEVIDRNIELVRRMLDWHRRFSPHARIIWTSSSEVYAGVPGLRIPTPEDTAVGIEDVHSPRYSYAVSKLAGELLVINYGREGAAYTIIRPHNIYGPRMGYDHVVSEFILRLLRRDDPFRIHGAETMRAFCHVDDFVHGVLAVLATPAAAGHVINLGDDRWEIRIRDLAERLFAIAGRRPRVECLPAPAGSTSRRRPALTKAHTLLSYEPRVDLDEGLRATYRWYEDH